MDQCLDAVFRASQNLSVEVFVVDNDSKDDSIDHIREKYSENHPELRIIENKENVGFSKANNQAINASKSKYILLLNPDTVVSEDTFEKTVEFFEKNHNAGGLGVYMIDGKGNFLPESKRGLPIPSVAFYKIFGLSNLFPKSKRFGQYHQGHLDKNQNHKVDVLSGAFMMMRSKALDNVGLLDEDFFMYGEDIDLSYRITQGGYDNHYFADTKIIHYKGESTKKSSINYVFVFYKAMVIFAKKHFAKGNANLFSLLIHLAIYLRAGIAILLRVTKKSFIPIVDFAVLTAGLYYLTNYWTEANIKFPRELLQYSIPGYGLAWSLSCFLSGSYDSYDKISKPIKGIFFGSIFILSIYALLPKEYQFSRLFILVGSIYALIYIIISRLGLHFLIGKKFNLSLKKNKFYSIVSPQKNFESIENLIRNTTDDIAELDKLTSPEKLTQKNKNRDHEVIFDSRMTYKSIIESMIELSSSNFDFKIAPSSNTHLIGSNSIDTAGDLYVLHLNILNSPEQKRKKRLFDIFISFGLFLFSPFYIFLFNHKKKFYKNIYSILIGRKSFIGFTDEEIKQDIQLPKIKEGIVSPSDVSSLPDRATRDRLNHLYSQDYSFRKDMSILFKTWDSLDK